MINKIQYFIAFTLVLTTLSIQAQTLERSVVSAEGDYVTSNNISLEYTIGETAIGQFSNSSINLCQGFNQSDTTSKNISIPETKTITFIELFPNPASDNIFVTSSTSGFIDVLDATGKVIFENIVCTASNQIELDVSSLTAGVYFLQVKGLNGNSTLRWVKNN